MASGSESSDSFESAYDELVEKLLTEFQAGVGRKYKLNLEEPDVYSDMLRFTYGFRFWKCLKKLLICVHRRSNAKKVVQNWESFLVKVEDAYDDFAGNIRSVCRNETISEKPMEAFYLLKIWEKMTRMALSLEIREALKHLSSSPLECFSEKLTRRPLSLEIGEALEHLSSSPLEWKWSENLAAGIISLCCELIFCIEQILGRIRQECFDNPFVSDDQNRKINDFFARVTSLLLTLNRTSQVVVVQSVLPNDDAINNFLTHLATVAVRTANQFFSYWINKEVDLNLKIGELLNLQHEIDPVSYQFLELILMFFRALYRIIPECSVSSFVEYMVDPRQLSTAFFSDNNGFKMKLETLILFVFNESEDTPSHSLMAEISAILPLVVFHFWNHHLVSDLELYSRICLLNAEVLLKQKLRCSWPISLGNQVEEIINFVTPEQKNTGIEEQTLKLLHDLAREVDSLDRSFNEKKNTEHMVKISLFKLLLKIVFFKAEFHCVKLLQLLDRNASMMGTAKDEIETFIEGLNLFKDFVTNHQEETITTDVELIFTYIEASSRGIITFCYSLETPKITEHMIEKSVLSFSTMLQKMTVKAKLRELYPTMSIPRFPKIPGLGFTDFLLENLGELLKRNPDSVALVKHRIERIQLNLEISRSLLMMFYTEHLESAELATCITAVAYEAEYIIDSIELGNGDYMQLVFWLHDVMEKIKHVNKQATNICRGQSGDAEGHNVSQIPSQMISRVSKPEIDELEIRVCDDEEIVIDRLMRGSHQRDIVSIVGMPGIGKTTLAKKVFNDPKVSYHFHVRTWCSVSQVYAKRELFLDILSDIASGLAEDIHQMTNEDLELKLKQCLRGKRYLIVLDDVWDIGAWLSLESSFPNDENGSRILMTSRLCEVALKAKPDSDPHNLRLFSDDESWELLQMKIFRGSCPEELLEVGKDIAKNCKGLPLAIVAIAGLLKNTDWKQDRWKKIAESLTSQLLDDPQSRCKDILQLSYNDLPDHLKACFLYFGAFFGNKDIPVVKLIRLWIAEGFIGKTMQKSLEDLAEDYLVDLIGRSLVAASKKGPEGRRIKTCRIHDLLRDFCLSKAKEENFLQLVTICDEPYASFPDLDFGVDYVDYCSSEPVEYEKHRVCICLNRKHFANSKPSGPCIRSLIFFPTNDQYPTCPYDMSFIPNSFKLLKVLDLENINMGISFPTGIESLVQLRYLATCGDIEFVPPAMSKLQKLETFIVKGLKGKVQLPDSIWCMERLRHLHVNRRVYFNFQDEKLGSSLLLENLVSFSSPSLAYGKDAKKILRRLPNLRKLRCTYLESWDAFTNYSKFPVLDFLIQLESLKVLYIGRIPKNPGELNLPWNLKKLTLSNFRLPWTHIGAIGRLQNLQVLKLLSKAFDGGRWDMRKGEFLGLKYLKLDALNIAQWNASDDHLPKLEQLVLQ